MQACSVELSYSSAHLCWHARSPAKGLQEDSVPVGILALQVQPLILCGHAVSLQSQMAKAHLPPSSLPQEALSPVTPPPRQKGSVFLSEACALEKRPSGRGAASTGVQPFGVSGPHWQKSCLGPHTKYIVTHNHKNISKFTILCWAAFTAILACMRPMGHRLDTPAGHSDHLKSLSIYFSCAHEFPACLEFNQKF